MSRKTPRKKAVSEQRPEHISRVDQSGESVWEISGISTWERLFVRSGEIRIVWQRYHPAYDEEPQIEAEVIQPGEFLGGKGHTLVRETFGEVILCEAIAETQRRNPNVKAHRFTSSLTSIGERHLASRSLGANLVQVLIGAGIALLFSGWLVYWPGARLIHQYRLQSPGSNFGIIRNRHQQ